MKNNVRVPNEVERDRSNLSGMRPVYTGGMGSLPLPPYTPRGYYYFYPILAD